MVAVVDVVTLFVLTTTLPVVLPADIVTLEGTLTTEGLSLERVTTAPPGRAGVARVIVATEVFPPRIVVGLSTKEASN